MDIHIAPVFTNFEAHGAWTFWTLVVSVLSSNRPWGVCRLRCQVCVGYRAKSVARTHLCPHLIYPCIPGKVREGKCLAQGHKCYDWDLNPHSDNIWTEVRCTRTLGRGTLSTHPIHLTLSQRHITPKMADHGQRVASVPGINTCTPLVLMFLLKDWVLVRFMGLTPL